MQDKIREALDDAVIHQPDNIIVMALPDAEYYKILRMGMCNVYCLGRQGYLVSPIVI